MSLDVWITATSPTDVFSGNITHNLADMAASAGIYEHIWHPDKIGVKFACEIIEPLRTGLALMRSDPDRFKKLEPQNRWGTYDYFVDWIERYIEACEKYPDGEIGVSR